MKGFTIAPVYTFRSPLPVSTTEGIDTNRNGEINDIPERAYQSDGVGNAPKDIGPCETYNCGRGAWRSQMNLRLSYGFRLWGSSRIEAIGEIFNVLNAKNPSAFTRHAAARHGTSESGLHAADQLLRRLPAAGAARRSARVPLLVLVRIVGSGGGASGFSRAPLFFW